RVTWSGPFAVLALWQRTTARKVGIGPHPSSRRAHLLIHQVAGPAVHRQPGKRTGKRLVRRSGVIEHRVTGRPGAVHGPAAVDKRFERLRKAGLEKQTLAHGGSRVRRAHHKVFFFAFGASNQATGDASEAHTGEQTDSSALRGPSAIHG